MTRHSDNDNRNHPGSQGAGPAARRALLRVLARTALAGALASMFAGTAGAAEPYPNKPIRIVNPWPAGGGSDVVSRIVAARLQARLGQAVIVDNVAGGSSIIGAQRVASAEPDGYTLLLTSNTTMSTNPWREARTPYDAARSFVPVSQVIRTPLVLIVNRDSPYRDVPALVADARAKRGALAYASFGNGTTGHISGELFKLETRTDMVHVPYKGSAPAIQDLIGGQVPVLFDTGATALTQVRAGRARGLAVMQPERSALARDIPSIKEFGYKDIDITVWFGLFAPAGTPAAIVQRLSREVQEIVREPEVVEKFRSINVEPAGSSPEAFADFLRKDRAEMGKVIRTAGIRLD
ncbi:tripartite tricarboxylate transporter substrate binding protein [Cupriavidus sp. WS]|uniref:Bug family tripartite tricarboxylate transporter substrate binding protein n=1 Tax=Cupriavidus sp. WS TaxID=1312922 RepID=UPI0003695808|nr:tripartite tricarboxylate transporter substrate binding protein [Cupriavidus sp. WS]